MLNTLEYIEITKEWLTEEIIKTHFKEKETNKKVIVKIEKIELLKLVLEVIKLNEKFEWYGVNRKWH